MTGISIHPAADLFPLLGAEELGKLAADIEANGLRNPVILYSGEVLDGRNRLAACELAGVEPRFTSYEGADPVAFVISTNLHRRHLSAAQLVAVSLEALPMFEAEALERRKATEGRPNKLEQIIAQVNEGEREPQARDKVADTFGVNRQYVSDGKRIKAEAPELIGLMKADAINVPQANELAKLGQAERDAAVAEIKAGAAARDVVKQASAHVSHNTGNNEWYTPAEYLEAARDVMGGIDLDPASSPKANEAVEAARFFTAQDDGLAQEWSGRVWMNPPYAQPLIGQFCERLIEELEAERVAAAMVLVNNATDTAWFHTLSARADALCFVRGRVKFLDPEGRPGAPLQGQVVFYFGPDPDAFMAVLYPAFGDVWLAP